MYGILKINKCKYTTEQYGIFKRYYCGMCDSLGKNFGNIARLTVNYDFTFLYLVLDSLSDSSQISMGVCPTTPWKRREITFNPLLHDFISAANVYLAGLKIKDDIYDQNSSVKKICYKAFKNKFKKARNLLHSFGVNPDYAEKLFAEQIYHEKNGSQFQHYYKSTALGLAYLLTWGAKLLDLPLNIQNQLRLLGYELGKIIYIMDSFVDYPADIKNERFNAIAQVFGDKIKLKDDLPEDIKEEIYTILTRSLTSTREIINSLPLKINREIIHLILNNLEVKIKQLVKNTKNMEEVEQIVASSSPGYLLTHPIYFLKSRAAHRRYHHRKENVCCCFDCDDLITTAICCDAADCDCDALECLSSGNPCELFECFC